ncbi:MAG: 50S ribosomal protein L15e [Nitrososphaerales archaeon]|nr:50S ribosomal protein L15e [Nitrososphaerales archaeon]
MYKYISESWKRIWKEKEGDILTRAIEWRHEPTIVRLERPTRIDRARRLGYKAKQGYVVVRVCVSKGGMRKERPRSGRRPKHLGVVRIKADVSAKEVAERRAAKKYPNLKVINSYFLYSDGRYKWYEVIMVDPNHPAVKRDLQRSIKG